MMQQKLETFWQYFFGESVRIRDDHLGKVDQYNILLLSASPVRGRQSGFPSPFGSIVCTLLHH